MSLSNRQDPFRELTPSLRPGADIRLRGRGTGMADPVIPLTATQETSIRNSFATFMGTQAGQNLAPGADTDTVMTAFTGWVSANRATNADAGQVAQLIQVMNPNSAPVSPQRDRAREIVTADFTTSIRQRQELDAAFTAFMSSNSEQRTALNTPTPPTQAEVWSKFSQWVNTASNNDPAATAMRTAPAGGTSTIAAITASPDLLRQSQTRVNGQFTTARTQDQQTDRAYAAFLATPAAQNAADANAAFTAFQAWLPTAAPTNPQDLAAVTAARGNTAITGPASPAQTALKERLATQFTANRTMNADERGKIDAAMAAFVASNSPERQALNVPNATPAQVMTQFNAWLDNPANATNQVATDARAARTAITARAGGIDVLNTYANGQFNSRRAAAASAPLAPAEEEEQGFFGKNKFGLIGGLIAAVLGFLVGGPIGGILGALIGFAGGNMAGDKDGLMSGLFNPGGNNPNIARAQSADVIVNGVTQRTQVVMIGADGKAGTNPQNTDRLLMGHFEGEGPNRAFVVERISFRSQSGPDGVPVWQDVPPGMRLQSNARGEIDLSNAAVTATIDQITTAGRDGIAAQGEQRRLAAGRAMNETLVRVVRDSSSTPADMMRNLQNGWSARLQVMGVNNNEGNVAIANLLGERYSNADFRGKPDSAARRAEILGSTISVGGQNMTVEQFLKGNGNDPRAFDNFVRAFDEVDRGIMPPLQQMAASNGGNLPAPAPIAIPGAARPGVAMASAAISNPVLGEADLSERLVPDGANRGIVALALTEPSGLANGNTNPADRRFMVVELADGNKAVLVGTMNADNKFVVNETIVNGVRTPMTGAPETRTFDTTQMDVFERDGTLRGQGPGVSIDAVAPPTTGPVPPNPARNMLSALLSAARTTTTPAAAPAVVLPQVPGINMGQSQSNAR